MSNMRSSDMSRGMTLRNAGEHRRLEGHIKTLDAQLKQNLVTLQAEIMEVKASPYAGRRNRSRSPARPQDFSFGKQQHARRFQAQDREVNGDLANENQRQNHKRGLPRIQVSRNENASCSVGPFLPGINADTCLVNRGSQESFPSPKERRAPRARNLYVAPHATNLYRPRSTPNILTTIAEDSASSGTRRQNLKEKQPMPVPGEDSLVKKRAEISRSSERLKDEGEDFGETERQKSSKGLAQAEDEEVQDQENASGEEAQEQPRDYIYCDEDLFRNSLLLKASRDDGLSTSLPDLKKLGFTDFNEVIDQRLRQLQEDIPSAEEMRKVRYLRFRDEPPPPDILSVFDKDS